MSLFIFAFLSQATASFAQESSVIFRCSLPIEGEPLRTVELIEGKSGPILFVQSDDFENEPIEIAVTPNTTQVTIPTGDPQITIAIQWAPETDYAPRGCDAQPSESGFSVTAERLDARANKDNAFDDPCRIYRQAMQPQANSKIKLECFR